MSTPNPLIPQGSLQSSGTSNVRIAVATIVAIHVVFFGGLLLQGCKREPKVADGATATNVPSNTATSQLTYPPIDSQSLYYPSTSALPADASTTSATAAAYSPTPATPSSSYSDPTPRQTNVAQNDPWRSSNLGAGTPAATRTDNAGSAAAKEYTVVRGDTYDKIARAHGTTVAAIRKANPGVEPTRIQPGHKLIVPAGAPAAAASSTSGGTATGNGASSGNIYVVKSGDNLTKIAREHGVTVSELRAANNLKVSRVDVGQKLKIPASTNAKAAPSKTAAAPTNTF